MAFASPNLTSLYATLGDEVVIEGESAARKGMFSEAGQLELGGEFVTTEPSLRYPVAGFPVIVRGTQLTVSNRTWKVRQAPRLLSDGKEAVVLLEEVRP